MNLFSAIALENLFYFAAGLLVGLLAGKLIGWARRRFARAQMVTDLGSTDMSESTERPRGLRGLFVIAVSIILFGSGLYTGFKVLEHEYRCLDDFANKSADASEARQADNAALQERDTDGWRAIEDVLAQKDPEAEKLKLAVRARIRAHEQLKTTREENPLPPPPREVC